jgi:integrase/recombinase XerC
MGDQLATDWRPRSGSLTGWPARPERTHYAAEHGRLEFIAPAPRGAKASSGRAGGEVQARSVRQSARMAAEPQRASTGAEASRQLELFAQGPPITGQVVWIDQPSQHSKGRDPPLTLGEAARIIREAVKDKSYRATPLGQLVGRYLRWFRNEYGAMESTIRDYEAVLARMSITLADKEPIEVSVDDLRDGIDLWGERSPRTRQKVTSVVRAFWSWAEEQGHIAISPAARIRRPRAEKRVASLLPADARPRLLTVAKHPRDRLALFCLLLLGVSRGELAGIQIRDFDAQRCSLRVRGKGRKERVLPLRGPVLAELRLFLSTDLPHVGRPPEPDDYLLYPTKRVYDGPRLGRSAEARRPRVPEEAPEPAGRPSLVVPTAPGGGARRSRDHARAQHAPCPRHVRDRAPARRRNRRGLAGARSRRPEHDARNLWPPRPDRPRDRDGAVRALAGAATGGRNRSSRS